MRKSSEAGRSRGIFPAARALRPLRVLRAALLGVMLAAWTGPAVQSAWSLAAQTLQAPVECLVCGRLHQDPDHAISYKGRSFHLCSNECLLEFQERERNGTLDGVTARIEPRSALFQEDSSPRDALSPWYLAAGIYVLLGLVAGGISAYLAVQKGAGAWSAFGLGFALNVAGIALVWRRPARELPFPSPGLTKVPSTREPARCAACGETLHPSARTCTGCGARLSPLAPSEVPTGSPARGE